MRLRRDIRWGVGHGVLVATGLSLYVTALAGIRGSTEFPYAGTTLDRILLAYYLSGVLAGATVGIFRRALSYRLGAFVVGWVAGSLIYATVAWTEGALSEWPLWLWTLPGLVMGLLALVLYEDEHPPASPISRMRTLLGVAVALLLFVATRVAGWW